MARGPLETTTIGGKCYLVDEKRPGHPVRRFTSATAAKNALRHLGSCRGEPEKQVSGLYYLRLTKVCGEPR